MDQRKFRFPVEIFTRLKEGRAYDLASGWWPGMPVASAHPPFQLQSFRTPRGMRNEGLFPYSGGLNKENYAFISEVISTTTHAGTHIDARCHVTAGEDDSWFGGYTANEYMGDFGPLRDDARDIQPFLARGVLLDIAGAIGVERMAPGQPIGPAELEEAVKAHGLALKPGDVVLLRTGFMASWPDRQKMLEEAQPGLSIDGAVWLREHDPALVGADNTSLEVAPSTVEGEPQPVHRYLIRTHGLPILEWVFLEDLAADGVREFVFLAVPLNIKGATGSLVRPLALV